MFCLKVEEKEIYSDGSYYVGSQLNGHRHGTGKFVFSDASFYEGQWMMGKMEGIGILYYSNGEKAYVGEWRENKLEGKGILHNRKINMNIAIDVKDMESVQDGWITYEGNLYFFFYLIHLLKY